MGFLLQVLVGILSVLGYFAAQQQYPKPRNFIKVTQGVWSLTEVWKVAPYLPGVPITIFLVHQDGKWVLIDAGVPTTGPKQPLAERLVAAVQSAIPEGDSLTAIVLTHGHFDHVGALPLLLDAYPEVPVVMHPAEEPFMVGDKRYASYTTLYARCLRWTGLEGEGGPVKVPASRVHFLDLSVPDLREYGLSSLQWIETPGHTPGHFSLLHTPSHILLASDAISLVRPTFALSTSNDLHNPRVASTYKPSESLPGITLLGSPTFVCPENCDLRQMRKSFCLLADDALDYSVLFAAHDSAAVRGGGWPKSEVQAFARSMPECQQDDTVADGSVSVA